MGKAKYPQHGFRLPAELVKEFEEVAKSRDLTRQEAMIQIMTAFIDKKESF